MYILQIFMRIYIYIYIYMYPHTYIRFLYLSLPMTICVQSSSDTHSGLTIKETRALVRLSTKSGDVTAHICGKKPISWMPSPQVVTLMLHLFMLQQIPGTMLISHRSLHMWRAWQLARYDSVLASCFVFESKMFTMGMALNALVDPLSDDNASEASSGRVKRVCRAFRRQTTD